VLEVVEIFKASSRQMSDERFLEQMEHLEKTIPTITHYTAWCHFTDREIAIRTLRALSKTP